MRVLAIDTATTALVTGAVDTESGQITQRILADARAHNERLMPTILEVMSEAGLELGNLDAIVAGMGPGPFTGLRVGMATAQALADALSIPLHGVCTHDAIAHTALAGANEKDAALVATDARRKEIYWATYRAGQRLMGPAVSKPGDLTLEGIAQIIIPEKLADQLPGVLAALPRGEAAPTAEGLVAVAQLDADPEPFVPMYLRRPDAVPPKKQQLSPAIPEVHL
ncbi:MULTISPECIES: tRNA (adenosine(37)-N6)-threonylcarbamoyltransferase complex dimerization subunit type 1 TsaB [Corynebacterium]|uniref:tRNA (adenosine(37)-N6)-threonylcarbamoyltransferase complex dimerization subunit type 1 TsaB n=1 Tax=Corynebacterium TaxID=1716 RepID=UPI0003B8D7E4|nr:MULTISPECIES: tRNA (adenosine(37)-N6)-threonylcarbamoyltransferase complex dimerization subunit type 1 TsaB [Corynebacterium]ERS42841.1 universal bacterial protein YeaZ [Corynebacterium sp. KPL1986]ERS43647.1 universal bacterial protein YeaZ [Corynebacterium sp. KPL1996]ERS74727.1 universal bacterial protein YeaZ [Corynebacterium sp. KPL2004]ERS75646.1 universal bacterial protein YeaZ [Corynebacterium sp. KPL1998]MCT1409795.1 tRNA (adenosine(37)-N6)-threonylcarbamoyltransferase complex dime